MFSAVFKDIKYFQGWLEAFLANRGWESFYRWMHFLPTEYLKSFAVKEKKRKEISGFIYLQLPQKLY